MRYTTIALLLYLASNTAISAQQTLPKEHIQSGRVFLRKPEQPRLIVGIVVDQMRYDYLYRYRKNYGKGGINRLLNQGFSCENTHYNYVPTYTGPGHAAIYTGTTPAVNGIVSNEWFDPEWGKKRYVTADPSVKSVGASGDVGQHSPRVMLSSTITDELRLSNNFQSKVVGVCLKDRGGILPAGHLANACYWFDDGTGNWITSSYYPDSMGLPQWVQNFNKQRLPDAYLAKEWALQQPATAYGESFANWNQFEKKIKGNSTGNFPYNLPAMKDANGYGVLRYTPFGNTITLDFALASIENMQLGADEAPDFLCLSFSSTDYCGHQFGIHAEETEDTYIRLDLELERLFGFLDKKFGKDQVLVFLTADHGAAETPLHMNQLRIPAGVFEQSITDSLINDGIGKKWGKPGNYIFDVSTQQVWFNKKALAGSNIPFEDAKLYAVEYLRRQTGVYDAYTREQLMALPADYPFAPAMRAGIFPRRSGDVFFQLDPAWHADDKLFKKTGTTHGSPYAYDSHVPLIWYGWGVRPGKTYNPVNITDIAPTLAAMLRIMEPNGTTGKVLVELMSRE